MRGRKPMNQKSKLTFGKIFERFAYGCGDFGCNIIYTAMSAFLLFYYTDYAGVSAMAVGTIMMISRVLTGSVILSWESSLTVPIQDSEKQDRGFCVCASRLQYQES